MKATTPIYTVDNCRAAYQLNWALALFWHELIDETGWAGDLCAAVERDGVRILKHRFIKPRVSHFLLSSRPEVSPAEMLRSVKGRLQYLVG
jgi:hypothetical protein